VSENKNKLVIGLAAAAGALAAYGAFRRASRRFELAGRTVLITGGSRGLGLVMAREFAARGARLAIIARDGEELATAAGELKAGGASVFEVACDVTDQSAVNAAVARIASEFGPVDVLVNNAGVIQVGPLEVQTQKDFEDAMQIHFWAPYYTMQAVIPEMRRRGEGRIVNISSIGGKIAVPHLAPYCASKFALAGMSSAMHGELAKDNIFVTTVYPGLMRTGSHINALFKGQNEKEFALFSLMNGLPLTSVSAENAARQIVDATVKGDAELIVSIQAKIAAKTFALFPNFTSDILALTARFLPGAGGIGTGYATGLDSRSDASPSWLTSLVDAASVRNNELKPNESIN
jgi:short-subunit dehydrogenase